MEGLPLRSSETFRIEQGEDQIGAQPQGYGQAEKWFEHDGSPSGAGQRFGVKRHDAKQDEAESERGKIGQQSGHDALLSICGANLAPAMSSFDGEEHRET